MYFATDKSPAIETITFNLRYAMKSALSTLTEGKRSINAMIEEGKPHLWQSNLSWNAEDWMKASYILDFAGRASAMLADRIQEVWDSESLNSDPIPEGMDDEFNAKLEVVAANVRAIMINECIRIVFRGVESISNPMSIINSKAKVEAAKHMLEVLGMNEYLVTDFEATSDILNGIERRESERRELRREQGAITPAKVIGTKTGSGKYLLAAYNKLGDVISTKATEVTRKTEAKAEAAQWAEELRAAALEEGKARGWDQSGPDRFAVAPPSIEL